MTTINNLSSLDVVSANDLVPLWSTANSDTRKATMEAVQTFVLTDVVDYAPEIAQLTSDVAALETGLDDANAAIADLQANGSIEQGPSDYDVFIPFSPNVFSISGITTGGVMTVSTVSSPNYLRQGMLLFGDGITSGTMIVNQATGTTGSTGTYNVSPSPGSAVGAVASVYGDLPQFGSGNGGILRPTVTFSRLFAMDALAEGGSFASGQYVGNYATVASQVAAFEYDPAALRYKYRATGAQITGVLTGGSGTANRQITAGAGWTLTNTTSAVNATGIDGAANTATTLTASAANGTATIALTQAAVNGTTSAFVKASRMSGRLWITRNNGTDWKDISQDLSYNEWTRVSVTSTQTNPTVGFKIENNADAFIIDCVNSTDRATQTQPMISRPYDMRESAMAYTSLVPAMKVGRRYVVGFKVKPAEDWTIATNTQPFVSFYPTGSAVTTNGYSIGITPPAIPVIQSWSGSALQINTSSTSSAATQWLGRKSSQPTAIYANKEVLLEYCVNLAQATCLINGEPQYFVDAFGQAKIDPAVDISAISIAGSGTFSDVYIRELRGPNVIIWGDSFTTEVRQLPQLLRSFFDPREVTIHSRGNGGYGWTTTAGGQLTSALFSTQCVPVINARSYNNVLVLWASTNDIAAGATAAQCLTQLQIQVTNALAAAVTAGTTFEKVIICTTVPRSAGLTGGTTQASFLAQSLLYNAGLSSITGITKIIDVAANAEFADANFVGSSATTWVADGIHLTVQGMSIVAGQIASAIR